jgi:hypothetical protein
MHDRREQYRVPFERDGFLILENHLENTTVEQILRIWRADPTLAAEVKENSNFEGEEGRGTRLAYRPNLGEDAYAALARSTRIVQPLEGIFDSSIQHYYTLNMQKDPGTGGWEYHQDYGYHYNEFFYPDFVSVMVALEPATRDNGCLRVVRGSHRLGRLEHEPLGSQKIANRDRVTIALEEMEEVHCEMSAGSVLFFHGNILHASNPNLSDTSRWSLIFAYVPSTNRWVLPQDSHLSPIDMLDDAALADSLTTHEQLLSKGA